MTRSPNAQRLVPCMPPLLEEEKIPLDKQEGVRYGGTACENIVKINAESNKRFLSEEKYKRQSIL